MSVDVILYRFLFIVLGFIVAIAIAVPCIRWIKQQETDVRESTFRSMVFHLHPKFFEIGTIFLATCRRLDKEFWARFGTLSNPGRYGQNEKERGVWIHYPVHIPSKFLRVEVKSSSLRKILIFRFQLPIEIGARLAIHNKVKLDERGILLYTQRVQEDALKDFEEYFQHDVYSAMISLAELSGVRYVAYAPFKVDPQIAINEMKLPQRWREQWTLACFIEERTTKKQWEVILSAMDELQTKLNKICM